MTAPGRDRYLGWALNAASFGCFALAGWLAWDAWGRWPVSGTLRAAQAAALAGKTGEARRMVAGIDGRDYPAAALLAFDPAQGQGLDGIRVDGASAPLLAAARALPELIAGRMPEGLDGPDRAVAKAALDRPLPPWPRLDGAPDRAILATALHLRLRAGWSAGRPDVVAHAAGALRMLAPQRPDADELALVQAVCSAAKPGAVSMRAAAIADQGRRTAVLERLVPLAGELSDHIRRLARGNTAAPTDELAARVEASSDPAALLDEVLAAGRIDQAGAIVKRMPSERRAAAALRVAQVAGDLGQVIELTVGRPEAAPRLGAVALRAGRVTAQFSNGAGFIPRGGFQVRLDGVPVIATDMVLRGPVLSVRVGPERPDPRRLQILVGGKVVTEAEIPR